MNIIKHFCVIHVLAFSAFYTLNLHAYSGGISGRSGAPGDSTCSACHDGSTSSYSYTSSFSGSTNLAPNTSSAYTFSISQNGGSAATAAGLNVKALSGSLTAGSNTILSSGEITHSTPDSSTPFQWSFNWTAPATVGTHTFYGCGNPVDGDGSGFDSDDGPAACTSYVITVNSAPTATTDTPSVNEDSGTTNLNVLSNDDAGGSGDSLSVIGVCSTATADASCNGSSVSLAGGDIAISGSGSGNQVSVTPDLNFNGTINFKYRIRDSLGLTDAISSSVTVNAQNDPPTAVNGPNISFNEDPGSAQVISALTGDSDVEDANSALRIVGFCDTATADASCNSTTISDSRGTIALSAMTANNNIVYTPATNYNTNFSLKYKIQDTGGATDTATVNISITAQNDQPTAVNGPDASFTEDPVSPVQVFALTGDSDVEDATSALQIVGICETATADASCTGTSISDARGSIALSANAANNHIVYTPAANYNTNFSIKYRIQDTGGLTDTATVSFDISPENDLPVAADGPDPTLNEDPGSPVTILALNGDSDVEDAATSLQIIGLCETSDAEASCTGTSITDARGSITLSAMSANNSIVYAPAVNYNTDFSFRYRIQDTEGGTSSAVVDVTITPQNDQPTAVDDTPSVDEDAMNASLDVLSNDTDIDSGDTKEIIALCDSAVTTVGGCSGTSYMNANGVVNLSAMSTSNTVLFTPTTNFNGTYSFKYVMEDSGGLSALASVTVTVNAVSDSTPVATADSISVNEGATVTLLTGGATSVLANDTGLQDTPITITQLTSPSFASSFSFNTSDGTFSYTHNGSENFTDGFQYRIQDLDGESSTGTVTITITPVSDSTPLAVNDSINLAEGATATTLVGGSSTVLNNDTGLLDTPVNVTVSAAPVYASSFTLNTNGTFSYTHDGSENFTDAFDYQIQDNDGQTTSATVNIVISPVSDSTPVAVTDAIAVNEGATITTVVGGASSVITNDTGLLDTPITTTLLSAPQYDSSFTLNPDGTFSYTHNGSENHTDSFRYSISDNDGQSSNVVVSISVTNVNDPPTPVDDNAETVNEDVVNAVIDVLANDTDPDVGDTAQIVGVCATAVADASCNTTTYTDGNGSNIAINAATTGNHLVFNPAANVFGSFSAKYKMEDAAGVERTASVTISITAVNDEPMITSSAVTSATRTELYTYNVTVNDPDDPNDGSGALQFGISSTPNVTGLSISNTGAVTWTPGETDPASNTVDVTVTVQDDLADGAMQVSQMYTINLGIPDMDNDTVADYDDNCPNDSNTDQANNDADLEGDVCDTDDDNDGMPDTFETANNLDPFDAADAALDADNDGVTNLAEFQNNSNPNVDDNPPVITVDTANINQNSTGVVTFVLPSASSEDALDGSLQPSCTIVSNNDDCTSGYFFGTGQHELEWNSRDAAGNPAIAASQFVNVIPQVSIDASRSAGEGMMATVEVSLNGEAVTYPVTVDYTVSGTADSTDHNAVDGTITFASGNKANLNVVITSDSIVESDETVVITLSNPVNAILSGSVESVLTITETNLPPEASISVVQGAVFSSLVYTGEGAVQFNANASDPNTGSSGLTYAWESSGITLDDAAIATPTVSNIATQAAGTYPVSVTVTDPQNVSITAKASLVVVSGMAPTLGASDSDNDGMMDSVEGLSDDDNDGLPNYLDPIDQSNLLNPEVNANQNNLIRLIETDLGLDLSLGDFAAGGNGALISSDQVMNDSNQTVVDINFNYVTGLYDFVISGVSPGDSASVVIPLSNGIPANAVYRKYNATDGWFTFVEDASNRIESAYSDNGVCPPVDSVDQYSTGLVLLADCVRLTMNDGGPNDADKAANGVIVDPGGIAVESENSDVTTVSSGASSSSRIAWYTLIVLALGLLVSIKRKNK